MFPGACRNTIYKLERGGRVRGPVDPTDGVGAASGDGVQVAGVRWLVAAGLDTSAEGFTFPPCHRIYHTPAVFKYAREANLHRLYNRLVPLHVRRGALHVRRGALHVRRGAPHVRRGALHACAAVPFTGNLHSVV